ncbi:MAG: hypothetical protein FJ207_08255 [Gemmatimonadetes bacterium]|nr:hypothetical protein [Gemmatimonadota bacterium]
MSAATALRGNVLVSRVTPTVKMELGELAATFREERGYDAPYWELVDLTREALATVRPSLAPALTTEGA